MKKTFLLSILIFSIFSCQNKSLKKDFIGNWSTSSDDPNYDLNIDIQYFKDSSVMDNSLFLETYSTKWEVKGPKIEGTILRNNGLFQQLNFVSDYKFSFNKDTLYIKHENDSMPYIKFLKINNGYEYFQNKIGLNIKLPKTDKELKYIGNSQFGLNVYVGYVDGKLIAKSESYRASNLDNILSQTFSFLASKEIELDYDNFQFNLFIDKNVNEFKIDSIKDLLKSGPFKRIFRIYTNEKVDYEKTDWKDEVNWFGVYE